MGMMKLMAARSDPTYRIEMHPTADVSYMSSVIQIRKCPDAPRALRLRWATEHMLPNERRFRAWRNEPPVSRRPIHDRASEGAAEDAWPIVISIVES